MHHVRTSQRNVAPRDMTGADRCLTARMMNTADGGDRTLHHPECCYTCSHENHTNPSDDAQEAWIIVLPSAVPGG